jgi:hypothetical protein
MEGVRECQWCIEVESVDHMLFRCPLATYVWAVVRDGPHWQSIPLSVKNLSEDFLFGGGIK